MAFFFVVVGVIYCALLINRFFLLKCWDRAFVYVYRSFDFFRRKGWMEGRNDLILVT